MLSGKRVLITGASGGVGAATARLAAEQGADLALLARGREGLERVAARARREGAAVHVVPVDLADRAAAERAVEDAVELLGGLDVVISNAAIAPFGHFDELDAEAFERTLAVTFNGAVTVIRAALPHFEGGAGVIVATGSTMARLPLPSFSSYAAAKHALRGFLGSLRVELRSSGSHVRVAMVHPGPIDSPLWRRVTTATGVLPRVPPDAYGAETIARALVVAAQRPRPELSVGLETRALEVAFALARPAVDGLLVFVDRWFRSGDEPTDAPGSVWEASGDGEESGRLQARPSFALPLRMGIGPPDPLGPVRMTKNLLVAAPQALRVARELASSRASAG